MAESLISLDQSRNPARFDRPEPKKAKAPELRLIMTVVVAAVFLLALVLFIWIIISLFSSKYSFDALPLLDSSKEAKSLNL